MSDLTITSSSVLAGADSLKQSGVAGVAIAAGDALYIDTSDSNKLKLAVATSAASSVFAGIALHAAAVGQPVTYMIASTITIGATLHIGTIYVVSATAGKLCPIADLVAGNYVTIVGMPTTTGILDVYPRSSGLALAA